MIFISLGPECYSARRRKYLYKVMSPEYKTCPFDLMFSNLNGIIKCFEDDFIHFTNPEYLTYKYDHPANDDNLIINSRYNFNFNHETPGHADLHLNAKWPGKDKYHFTDNNLKMFIERYDRRIKNLLDYMNNNNNIVLIIKKDNETKRLLPKLREVLKKKYPNKNIMYDLF